ncbi:MAG TPA: PAS domain S-box protein [Magnetospirillaceae bacterium]
MRELGSTDISALGDTRYRLLVESVTDYAIYMLDAAGYVTSWNTGAQRIKGYTAAEILGQHFSRFYAQTDRDIGLPQRALDTAGSEGRFEGEGWRLRKDGTRFWAHVIIDPVRTPNGDLIGFAKITRDLTERRKAEEKLKHSQEQFRLLVRSVTDYAIYMLDPDGRITNWNLGAERIKGYRPDEIIGQHFSKFYTEVDRVAGVPRQALETARLEGRFSSEGWRVRKDGSRFWASVVIDPILDDDGVLIGFAKITRDLTEWTETRRALDQAREALFQSQKIEAVGQLTGGIAHDFNNLLMAVITSLELMRKRLPDDPKLTSLYDNALQGAQRGASLTQRMLAFARRQDLNLTAVDLPNLVRGMSNLLQRSLGPTIIIETKFPTNLPTISADANQLELALLNLAVNARDAMPNGGTIVIAAHEERVLPDHTTQLSSGNYVCFSVTDAGEGMDEITLSHAMEPFFTTKGIGKGTGLGLSMVHGLMEQFGGRLLLDSKKGKGTRAELWLPVGISATPAAPAPTPVDHEEQTGPLTVLVVDDDPLVLHSTAYMLEDLGHTPIEAESGAQALDMLRQNRTIDLVLTDQAMPRMTGSQFAEHVRAEWPQLPIILASGYSELPPGLAMELLRLAKPFRHDDLARAITEATNPLSLA